MIEPKDLEAIQKICDEMESLGYAKGDISMSEYGRKANFTLRFSKTAPQTHEEE